MFIKKICTVAGLIRIEIITGYFFSVIYNLEFTGCGKLIAADIECCEHIIFLFGVSYLAAAIRNMR